MPPRRLVLNELRRVESFRFFGKTLYKVAQPHARKALYSLKSFALPTLTSLIDGIARFASLIAGSLNSGEAHRLSLFVAE